MPFEETISRQKRGLALSAAVLLASALCAFCQTPPNDNFANATLLTGTSITFTGTLVGATFESIETNSTPPFAGLPLTGGSVWWAWTAPQSSAVVIQLIRDYTVALPGYTDFDVFSGTNLNALTWEGENSFDRPFARYVAFTAGAGVTYYLRMAGPLTQPFSLKLTATNMPVFVMQPKDTVVAPHQSAFFYARAAIFPGMSHRCYQWKSNGVPIPDQTSSSLIVYNVTTNSIATYSVTISNAAGITESAPATLTLLDTNPVPWLAAAPSASADMVSISLTGQPGKFYQIESSSDLINWGNRVSRRLFTPTQIVSVPRLGPVHFVRAWLDTRSDACIAQLQQLNWAVGVYRTEYRLPRTASYTMSDLLPFVPLTEDGHLTPCPAGGTYYPGAAVVNPVYCNIAGHVLSDDQLAKLGFLWPY